MKIAISAESTIDLPLDLLKKYNISTIPFNILINDEIKPDCEGISNEIFENVAKFGVLPKTSAINQMQYKEYFEKLLKNYDAVVHISLSSNISCTYENAYNCAKQFKDKVFVVDSKSLSTGIALLAIHACNLKNQNKSAKEIYNLLSSYTHKLNVSFVIDTLQYLYKGGRCSALTLFGANVLKIKPQILMENGKMVVGKKFVGNLKSCISRYCDDVLSKAVNPDKSVVFITRSSDMTDIVEMVKTKLKSYGFQTIYDTMAGGTICSHCGPNCLGILFVDNSL